MTKVADNVNPNVYEKESEREITSADHNEEITDDFDEREIFDLIRNINDPEHPLTLEELRVVEEKNISVDNKKNEVLVHFTPTIPHCSMATLIGLSIRVQLLRALPSRFKVTVEVSEGTHVSEHAVNKQLADKERVAAALENNNLVQIINQCVAAGA
ncbi:PREDICTED: MIP18 family protein CG7949 [Papilio polytes]|uniref:Simila to CG7949 n=1 Tax=Papilio polytes TaxID=76194 RepID=I4DRD1_PAPPL|nr:MIP18 family protein CG7949 [Papilio polytes]XP_013145159.1 PREDICTED: MIP18 family protein CG7949 [Papilio polytes]BAM20471.1 simila to CG7949 [Papilio polytes]